MFMSPSQQGLEIKKKIKMEHMLLKLCYFGVRKKITFVKVGRAVFCSKIWAVVVDNGGISSQTRQRSCCVCWVFTYYWMVSSDLDTVNDLL